jgi:hypothetical protein
LQSVETALVYRSGGAFGDAQHASIAQLIPGSGWADAQRSCSAHHAEMNPWPPGGVKQKSIDAYFAYTRSFGNEAKLQAAFLGIGDYPGFEIVACKLVSELQAYFPSMIVCTTTLPRIIVSRKPRPLTLCGYMMSDDKRRPGLRHEVGEV